MEELDSLTCVQLQTSSSNVFSSTLDSLTGHGQDIQADKMDSEIILDDDLAHAFTHRSEQDLFLASDINSLDLEENILNTSESIEQSNWYTSQSDFFVASSESAASSTSNHQRRRRRKKVAPYKTRRANPEKRRYQCTFCTDVFKTKHDWQRHERSLHLSLDEWR
jgi:hypothetical protein